MAWTLLICAAAWSYFDKIMDKDRSPFFLYSVPPTYLLPLFLLPSPCLSPVLSSPKKLRARSRAQRHAKVM
eukprot:6206843-Pyramimonas_sp.AAC.1